MINQIDQVFNRAKRKANDRINFLWFPYNGIFEYLFCQFDFVKCLYSDKSTLHNEWRADDWPHKLNFVPSIGFIDDPIDICIANHRQTQAFKAADLSKSFHMPTIVIDHEPTAEGSRSGMVKYINRKMPQDLLFVSTHNLVKESWMYDNDNVIEYGFKLCDKDLMKGNEFLLIGDYAESDTNFINIVKDIVPGIETSGYNIGTEPFNTTENLVSIIARSRACISAAQSLAPPLLQILAASQNTLVITSANMWTNTVFKNNETALLYNSIDDLKGMVRDIKNEKIDVDGIIKNAREMVDKDFNFESSQSKWKKLLTDIANRTFVI